MLEPGLQRIRDGRGGKQEKMRRTTAEKEAGREGSEWNRAHGARLPERAIPGTWKVSRVELPNLQDLAEPGDSGLT
jgi:hypothetical protein